MNPASLMLGVSGLALQTIGGIQSYKGAKAASESQAQQIMLEQKAEGVKRQYMEMDARRKKMENFRKAQQLHALALNNATTQGAQFGSGLAGGQAQVSGEAGWNEQGINQSLMTGRDLFDINSQISGEKMKTLQAQKSMMQGQALSSIGSSLMGGMGQAGQLTGGTFSSAGTSIWDSYSGGFMKSGLGYKGA